MQKIKLTRVTAIIIGVVVSFVIIGVGLATYLGVFSRASDSAPRDVTISNITTQSAIITWTTDQTTQGVIEYGTTPADLGFYAPEPVDGQTHSVDLSLLTPGTTHYFVIRIDDTVYDNGGLPWTFTTKSTDVATNPTATPSAGITGEPSGPASAAATLAPTATDDEEATPTKSPTPTKKGAVPTLKSSTATMTPIPTRVSCSSTNCASIAAYLGPGKCSVSDYQKCLYKTITATITPSISVTPTGAPVETPSNTQANLNSDNTAIVVTFSGKNNVFSFEIWRYSSNLSGSTPTATPTIIAGSTTDTTGWTLVREILGPDSTSTSSQNYIFTDTGVSSGYQYKYRVRAKSNAGTYSNYGPGTGGTSPITMP